MIFGSIWEDSWKELWKWKTDYQLAEVGFGRGRGRCGYKGVA